MSAGWAIPPSFRPVADTRSSSGGIRIGLSAASTLRTRHIDATAAFSLTVLTGYTLVRSQR